MGNAASSANEGSGQGVKDTPRKKTWSKQKEDLQRTDDTPVSWPREDNSPNDGVSEPSEYSEEAEPSSVIYDNFEDDQRNSVLTPPRHSPIQILNAHDNVNRVDPNVADPFQTPPRPSSQEILFTETPPSTIDRQNNFKTPSPTKDNFLRLAAATTSRKAARRSESPRSGTKDMLKSRSTSQPSVFVASATPGSAATNNSHPFRRQAQSAPNRRDKRSARRKVYSPRSRNKKLANYRKSMLSQSLSVQQRYRKKLEREKREKVSRSRTQEKREKRYHFALNAWQQIDCKEWRKDPKNYFKRMQSVIKTLVKRYGIPSPYRHQIWELLVGNDAHITKELYNIFYQRAMEISNAEEDRERNSNTLPSSTIDNPEDSDSHSGNHRGGSGSKQPVKKEDKNMYGKETSVLSISVDLNRTFPRLAFFRHDGSHHKPLKEVLATYCFYRPDCGYVQGMSFLAAMLLLQLGIEDPYKTFVLLVNIMRRDDGKLLKFYKLDPKENNEIFRKFEVVLESRLPVVSMHLKKVGITPDMYLLPWWITIFSKYLGLDLAVRVWDGYMVFGTPYLTQVALGILNICRNDILRGDFGTCLRICLRDLPASITEDMLFDSIDAMG
eukprot:g4500.t1